MGAAGQSNILHHVLDQPGHLLVNQKSTRAIDVPCIRPIHSNVQMRGRTVEGGQTVEAHGRLNVDANTRVLEKIARQIKVVGNNGCQLVGRQVCHVAAPEDVDRRLGRRNR